MPSSRAAQNAIQATWTRTIPTAYVRQVRRIAAGQLRDVAYQALTTEFWGSLDALGGPSTWQVFGAMNCGKAQPGQSAPVGHGCPSALFRQVNVLNTTTEAS